MVKFPTKFDDFVPPAALGKLLEVLNQPALSSTVREALQRVGIKDGNPIDQVQNAWQQARSWLEAMAQRVVHFSDHNPAVINATGQLVLSQWTNLPMHPSVAQSIAAAAVSFQDQERLAEHARQVAIAATGAEDVVFTSSMSAAIETVVNLTEYSQGLVVSRTDAIRVPGFTDVREVLARNNRTFCEIGAVNGTCPSDWTAALRSSRQAAVLVSPNCLEPAEAAVQRAHAIAAARLSQSSVIEILFDATVRKDLADGLGLPTIQQCLSSGADLVISPLDWFIGGPTGAMVAGKLTAIASLKALLDSRGFLMRGAALAGAATCLSAQEVAEIAESGVARLLLTSTANLTDRARRIVTQVEGTAKVKSATVIQRPCKLGPSPWNRYSVPSVAIHIEPTVSVSALRHELAHAQQGPVILTAEDAGRLLVDLRLVDPSLDHYLVLALLGKTEVASSA